MSILIHNLIHVRAFARASPWVFGTSLTITTSLVVFFGFSPFRLYYLNPHLQWWETSPRFRAEVDVSVEGLSEPGVLEDISLSSPLVTWPKRRPTDLPTSTRLKLP